MSVSQATIELLFQAKNLAEGAVADVVGTVGKVGQAGTAAASKFAGAFSGIGGAMSNALGNSVENLAQGGSLDQTLFTAGAYMAGQLAEQFGGQMLEKLAGSSIIAAIAAPLGAIGTAAGGLIAAAIPIGMAALPFILIGALVAAITILIVNPEIRGKVIDFVAGLVGKIGDALRTGLAILADIVPKAFMAAWQLVVDGVKAYIGFVVDFWTKLPERLLGIGGAILHAIVSGLSGLAGALFNIVGDAFRSLRLDIGPFHISAAGVRVDLPNIDVPHFAGGVRNFGGGMAVVGERGPELVRLPTGADVIPNSQAGAAAGGSGGVNVTIQGVSERELVDVVERGLYVRLRAAGTTY